MSRWDDAMGLALAEAVEAGADQHGADEGRGEAEPGDERLHDVAQATRQERLDEHPGAGGAEDDEQRPELAVLDGGLHELHQ